MNVRRSLRETKVGSVKFCTVVEEKVLEEKLKPHRTNV